MIIQVISPIGHPHMQSDRAIGESNKKKGWSWSVSTYMDRLYVTTNKVTMPRK